jgi:hypothetical protein
MANQEHLDILAKGVAAWNAWRAFNVGVEPDLSGANLGGKELVGANFQIAKLTDAVLVCANLTLADFREADVARADLEGANLVGAVLQRANLADASFRNSKLMLAVFDGSVLAGADFTQAWLYSTLFGHVTLNGCKGLEAVQHRGPSTISLDTIYRGKGQIPEAFLRGAGVPENFITYMRTLTGAALDFYSCFISYSTKDQSFADRLFADLQARGVRCWFAPHDIQGGKKIHEQIDEAIRVYDKLLLILSDASMNSNWVKTEIANARAREQQQKRQMLFPITLVPFDRVREWKCFDADTGIDSAREIREYHIPDFSDWKDHDSYAAAFERLVRDLKANPSIQPDGKAARLHNTPGF